MGGHLKLSYIFKRKKITLIRNRRQILHCKKQWKKYTVKNSGKIHCKKQWKKYTVKNSGKKYTVKNRGKNREIVFS